MIWATTAGSWIIRSAMRWAFSKYVVKSYSCRLLIHRHVYTTLVFRLGQNSRIKRPSAGHECPQVTAESQYPVPNTKFYRCPRRGGKYGKWLVPNLCMVREYLLEKSSAGLLFNLKVSPSRQGVLRPKTPLRTRTGRQKWIIGNVGV